MTPRDVDWGASGSSDNGSVSLTSTVFSEEKDEPYNLEAVLAEKTNENGKKRYLVKWEGYDNHRNTWEKKKHFQFEQTLLDWRDQKMQITRGRAKAFDVDAWEREVGLIREATEKRRARRRAKRISLGISVDEWPGTEAALSEPSYPSGDSSDETSSDTSVGVNDPDPQSRTASPVWTPREETTLLEALQLLKAPNWDAILGMYGPIGSTNQELQRRTKAALHRKAAALQKDFDTSGKEFPIPVPLSDPLSDRSFAIPTSASSKKEGYQSFRDGPRLELVESLKAVGKHSGGKVSKASYLSESVPSRKREPDHWPPERARDPEQLRVGIPAPTSKALEVRSATTAPKSDVATRIPTVPASAAPWLPNRVATEKLTHLGTIGRGPARARRGLLARRTAPPEQVNVMGNWGAQPSKRRKSRYEPKDPTDSKTKNLGKFKKFSTQRKHELAGRFERTPDINSLTFVDLKDGKALPKPPASVARRPSEKTPFQMLQESMLEKQDKALLESEDTLPAIIDVTPTTPRYLNERRLSTSDSRTANDSETAISPTESAVPVRQTSLPIEPYSQPKSSSPQPFAAPVAMMRSGKEPSQSATTIERRQTFPHVNSDTTTGKDKSGRTAIPLHKSAIHQASGSPLQQTEGNSNVDDDATVRINDNVEDSNLQRRKPSMSLSRSLLPNQTQSCATTTSYGLLLPVVQLPSEIPCLQPQEDGYALFPFDIIGAAVEKDTVLRKLDVIAEILTGATGDSSGAVIFRGLEDFHLKQLFLTIRMPPRQMHVNCETMCTAGEYITFFHGPDRYLGSGWIVPFPQAIEYVDRIGRFLAEYSSGALFFADKFSLLLYPARCVAWRFLDDGLRCNPSSEAKLRFAIFTPQRQLQKYDKTSSTGSDLVTQPTGAQLLHINRVFQTHFDLKFSRLVAPLSDKKTLSTDTFFLLFPFAAREDCNLFIEWIQANSTAATIYRFGERGAWDHFHKSNENGAIICHASFFEYWAFPYLSYVLKKAIRIYRFSSEPMSDDAPDRHLIRLFPAGQVILLADSLFLVRPMEAARLLAWFRLFALPTKPLGTWKVCTRPAIRNWLLNLQERFYYPHGEGFVRCYGEIMRLLPNHPSQRWHCETPKDGAPVVCMGHGEGSFDLTLGTSENLNDQDIMENDVSLVNWFAGWAMTKHEKFRKFLVVTGREEVSEQHKSLKESARKYSHISIMSLEKFEHSFKMWDWVRIEREDEARRAEAAKADEKIRQENTSKALSPDLPDYEDEDLLHSRTAKEESLFLPMDVSG
ncbi:MAG: hypothetical protein Q9176_001538 [Flavoplaca citrina]